MQISHATQLQHTLTCSSGVVTYFSHAYHYCQEPCRPHIGKIYHTAMGHWYFNLAMTSDICLRYAHAADRICLCISISNSERWSRNIVMMSRWFALKPISSSKGRSHSMRTSIVCTIRKILVTFSNPTIHSMYRSSIASRNGRLSRLSIPGIDYVAIPSLSLNATVPTTLQWFLNSYFQRLLGQLSESLPSKHPTCVSRTYSQPQPIWDILNAHLQASCRSLHCPNTSLVSPGLTPNLSLSRYSKHSKTMSSPAINWQVTFNQWPHSQHAQKWNKNTHHLNQEYSNSSMPLTLHQQCTNLVIDFRILSTSSTQIPSS